MGRLFPYVAEIACTHFQCKETWSLHARSLSDARRRLQRATGKTPHSLAKVESFPVRHWKAG